MSESVNPNSEYGRLQAEIARLRAEVERIKEEVRGNEEWSSEVNEALARVTDIRIRVLPMIISKVEKIRHERDEALAALNDAKKALKIMNQNLDDLSSAKQEALAQVAVLILALEDALSDIHYHHGCDSRCQEKRHILASPLTKARTLLDRLAMLEDGAMTNQRLVWLEDRLQRAEAVVEGALSAFRQICTIASALEGDSSVFKRINDIASSQCVVLAAWKEGKA